MKKISLICILLVYCSSGAAESLDQLEKNWNIQNNKDPVVELLESIATVAKQREYECKRAFGSNEFCKCLSQELPVSVTFMQYNAIVIRSKEQLLFETTSEENKKLVNAIYSARNKCVIKS